MLNVDHLVQRLHTQKPGIVGILEYSKPLHNCIPTYIQSIDIFPENLQIFRTLTYLEAETYSEPSQRFKMEFFFLQK